MWTWTGTAIVHRRDVLAKVRLGMTPEQIEAALELMPGTLDTSAGEWRRKKPPIAYEADLGHWGGWESWLIRQEVFILGFTEHRKLVAVNAQRYARNELQSEESLQLRSLVDVP